MCATHTELSHALPKPATEDSRAMEIVQDKAHRSLRMNAYSPYAEFAGEEQRSKQKGIPKDAFL